MLKLRAAALLQLCASNYGVDIKAAAQAAHERPTVRKLASRALAEVPAGPPLRECYAEAEARLRAGGAR